MAIELSEKSSARMAIVSTILSVVAIFSTLLQAFSERHYSKLGVHPNVVITPLAEGASRLGLYISNDGLGPALLKDIRVDVNGQHFRGFGSSPLSQAAKAAGLDPMCFARGWPKEGTWLKVGQETPFLAMTSAIRPECIKEALRLITVTDMHIEIDYEDLDGDAFQFVGNSKTNDADAMDLVRRLGD